MLLAVCHGVRLTHEVAYEHWHRMLFARFLAENDLLIHPKHGVAVSLDEIEELAREAGEDPRDMAARSAARFGSRRVGTTGRRLRS